MVELEGGGEEKTHQWDWFQTWRFETIVTKGKGFGCLQLKAAQLSQFLQKSQTACVLFSERTVTYHCQQNCVVHSCGLTWLWADV